MDISELIDSKDYIVLPRPLLKNPYYQWVLTTLDKIILSNLFATVGYKNNPLYDRGLLVSNLKEKELIARVGRNNSEKDLFQGYSSRAIRRRTAMLDKAGIIIKVRRKYSTNYIVGFRSEAQEFKNNNCYFLYYLCANYDTRLLEYKSTKDIDVISLPKETKEFIRKNYNDPILFRTILPSGKGILEELFGIEKYVGWARDQVEQKIIPLHSNRDRTPVSYLT